MSIINVILVGGFLVGGFLLFKFKKLETLALLAALKAESFGLIGGSIKLEWAVEWLYSQKLFKDSFLALIPKNVTKWVVNFVFNRNRLNIEKESKAK